MSIITLGEEKVKDFLSFKYLGHLITSDPKTYTIGHKNWERLGVLVSPQTHFSGQGNLTLYLGLNY